MPFILNPTKQEAELGESTCQWIHSHWQCKWKSHYGNKDPLLRAPAQGTTLPQWWGVLSPPLGPPQLKRARRCPLPSGSYPPTGGGRICIKVLPFQPSTGLGSEGPYILHDDPRDWQRLCQACVAVPLPHGHSPSAGIPSKILQAKVQLRECSLGI